MPVLDYEDKLALLDKVSAVDSDSFSAPPTAARGREAIRWEVKLNLELFRAHAGNGAAILPVLTMRVLDNGAPGNEDVFVDVYDEKATKSIRASITGRLAKVAPGESWTTYEMDEMIYLKFNGAKVKREAKPRTDEVAGE